MKTENLFVLKILVFSFVLSSAITLWLILVFFFSVGIKNGFNTPVCSRYLQLLF